MHLAEQINRVIRRVTSTGERHTIVVEQEFPVAAGELWAACTEAGRLARWFEPVTGDLRPGGRYRLTGSGTEGTIERCEPPARLAITWEYGGDVSHVALTLTPAPAGAGTVLRLEHTAADSDYWRDYGPAAGGAGWDESLLALSLHLAGDPRSGPAEMAELTTTDEGREFARHSVAAWQAAHVEAGADRATAQAAATRTLEFYSAG